MPLIGQQKEDLVKQAFADESAEVAGKAWWRLVGNYVEEERSDPSYAVVLPGWCALLMRGVELEILKFEEAQEWATLGTGKQNGGTGG